MKRIAALVLALAVATLGFGQTSSSSTSTTTTTKTDNGTTKTKKKTHGHHRNHTVRTYTVQSGDTFGSIASKTGTTVARLEQLNPGVDPAALHVGQKIRVQ